MRYELCLLQECNHMLFKDGALQLKARLIVGQKECPVHVTLDHQERLQKYEDKKIEIEKANQMANAKKKVKVNVNVGCRGKQGKYAEGVSCNSLWY